ncbi:hypothetical protein BDZ97DRAFT_1927968 [Flammula alnicola]|nr:hypothetical protein BDZ97DRAFT_1927968 [Flammula alnicola]
MLGMLGTMRGCTVHAATSPAFLPPTTIPIPTTTTAPHCHLAASTSLCAPPEWRATPALVPCALIHPPRRPRTPAISPTQHRYPGSPLPLTKAPRRPRGGPRTHADEPRWLVVAVTRRMQTGRPTNATNTRRKSARRTAEAAYIPGLHRLPDAGARGRCLAPWVWNSPQYHRRQPPNASGCKRARPGAATPLVVARYHSETRRRRRGSSRRRKTMATG